MAITPLNLTPGIQSWHFAGLSCLLCSGHTAAFLKSNPAVQGEQRLPAGHISGDNAEAYLPQPAVADTGQEKNRLSPRAAATALSPRVAVHSDTQTHAPAHPDLHANLSAPEKLAVITSSTLLDPALFPAAWQKIFAKVKPAPIVWTYPELGQDLLLQGDLRRSTVLKELIQSLHLKKGSSAFWPASLPDSYGEGKPDAGSGTAPGELDIFCAGLDFLGAKYLIVLGSDSLRDTAYARLTLKPFTGQIHNGRLILPLPSFDLLLADKLKLETVTKFLRSILSNFYSE